MRAGRHLASPSLRATVLAQVSNTVAHVARGAPRPTMVLLFSPKGCQVLGDFFGFIVQGLLFAFCVGSLLLKWCIEVPRRKFKIFLLDSSKQIVGAGCIHCLNMVCAMWFAGMEIEGADECAWYWVNIMVDTTFGCIVCWGFLKISELLLGYDSGNYGKGASTGIDWESNPDYWTWSFQISIWCVIVCLMKLVVVGIMFVFSGPLSNAAIFCTHWIKDLQWRLIFVMIVTPTCMNMFQFWVTDSFIKWKGGGKKEADS